ncbi:MAG TPA: DUF2784 family protein [Spirochaetota bacterium]|nr:DUF2784 family protein [Spirochaetota bacterium]
MLVFLNIFFFVFHTVLIVFNLFGWVWKRTRLANLVTLGGTAFCWFILGIWYGFGYCPSTEWHWQVRLRLGFTIDTYSYTKFLVDTMTGLDVNAKLVDTMTAILFLLALGASVFTNIKQRLRVGG